jgi:hypothetical protein
LIAARREIDPAPLPGVMGILRETPVHLSPWPGAALVLSPCKNAFSAEQQSITAK